MIRLAILAAALPCVTVCNPAHSQNGGYQIQQKIDDQWQVFRTPRGNYAGIQSDTACALDLASAVNVLPSGTILACRRVRPMPTPIQRNVGN